jgi:hypothetical protein
MKGWDVYKDPKWILDNLLKKYKVVEVATAGGWYSSVAGSGGLNQNPFCLYVSTGLTANSRGMSYQYARLLNSGDINRDYVDWTKDLEIRLQLFRANSDPQCIARFQLKEASSEGALAQCGIGLEVQNFTVYGEGYGTARGTVSLLTLSESLPVRVRIVKVGSLLQFYVNDALMGTLTGNYVPNTKGTASAFMVISVINGSTGGIDCLFGVGNIRIIQKW